MLNLINEGGEVWAYGRTTVHDVLIDQVTRFKSAQAEWTKKYQQGKWDGHVRLYSGRTGRFPAGLLFDVEMQLLAHDVPYTVIDKRPKNQWRRLRAKYLDWPPLYYFQEEALAQVLKHKRGVVSLPTGTGKTRLATAIVGKLKLPTVFFVGRERLLKQAMKDFSTHFNIKIGQIGSGKVDIRPITVATVQTATNLPPETFRDFGVAFFDEAHHVAADTVFDIAKNLHCEYVMGLSATPTREDGRELMIQAGTGHVIYYKSTSELIWEGFLARPEISALHVSPIYFDDRHKYEHIVREGMVHNRERNLEIAMKAVEESLTGKVYIHVNRLEHGPILVNTINNQVLQGEKHRRAAWLCGSHPTKMKDKMLHEFGEGDRRILVSTLLGEGVDVPSMYCLIMAGGGGKGTKVTVPQILGRVLRRSDHKTVRFYDIADKCKYLGDHFKQRCQYYVREPAFMPDPYIQQMAVV